MSSGKKDRRVGLARALSKLGFCSRAQAVPLIRDGRVKLNDRVRRDPEFPVRLAKDCIVVDGRELKAEQKIYLVMNKRRGLVTSASDERGRETVYSILENSGEPLPWVAPVGRLDKASEGLLVLTNDSEWAARIAAPETHLNKTYHVQIDTPATQELLNAAVRGLSVDGDFLRASQARLLRSGEKNSWIEIILDEGKNRHIRRMLAAIGVEVLRLVRVSIGPLALGNLAKGTYRHLSAEEKRALDRALEETERRRAKTGEGQRANV